MSSNRATRVDEITKLANGRVQVEVVVKPGILVGSGLANYLAGGPGLIEVELLSAEVLGNDSHLIVRSTSNSFHEESEITIWIERLNKYLKVSRKPRDLNTFRTTELRLSVVEEAKLG